jgi:hypothetical protein
MYYHLVKLFSEGLQYLCAPVEVCGMLTIEFEEKVI